MLKTEVALLDEELRDLVLSTIEHRLQISVHLREWIKFFNSRRHICITFCDVTKTFNYSLADEKLTISTEEAKDILREFILLGYKHK